MRRSERERRTSLVVAGREMPLVVRRHPQARRLTLRLLVSHDGVMVTIPEGAAFSEGVALARKNSKWIAKTVAARPQRVACVDGAIIPLRGIDHEIRHRPGASSGIRAETAKIRVGGAAETLTMRLEAWLRRE